MKIDVFYNGQRHGWSRTKSVLYFFLPSLDPLDGLHIKAENSSYFNFATKKVTREYYTFRALWAYFRYMPGFILRQYAESMAKGLDLAPKLALRIGAIAFDATIQATVVGSTSSTTYSHTTGGGSNRYMACGTGYAEGTYGVSTVKYGAGGGTALTQRAYSNAFGYGRAYIHDLAAPDTGASDVVVTYAGTVSAGDRGGTGVVTYTGCAQASTIDVTGTTSVDPGTAQTITLVTTVANDWIFNCHWWGGSGTTAVTQGETARWDIEGGIANGGADKATTTAGSYNTGWSGSVSNSGVMAAISFKESSAAVAKRLALLGVG